MFKNKSLLGSYWELKNYDERLILSLSQQNQISPLLAKLLLARNIKGDFVNNFLNPNVKLDFPNPFLLKDMKKSVNRVIKAIKNNENIGIIADYDVDGSTSASILYKFLQNFSNKILLKIPNRLLEGYGPNMRILDEMIQNNINLIFTLDCGTSSHDIIDNIKYKNIDVIIIDHHLSEPILPKIYSIINPNRHDEKNDFKNMAAVGVTFLFLMALRQKLREQKFFNKNIIEPNLLSYLDLVALGTVCDVVDLTSYNRLFVKIGLGLIKQRKNINIAKIIDNSNLNSEPNSSDLGFIIGPQLNAASRLDDSSLPSKLLISDNIADIDSISKKLILLNEKRKLIEKNILDEAITQAIKQNNQNFLLVYGIDWHKGVLGIVASRLMNKFHKPTIVISFMNSIGFGSARSIPSIDLGNIILSAKNKNILINGGGHKMAAGLKINYTLLKKFSLFLTNIFDNLSNDLFQKIETFDSDLSANEINYDLLDIIDQIEPFGSGNPEPKFIIKDFLISNVKILKDKHLLIFFQNDFSSNLRGICFNCLGTNLGDYLLNFKKHKLALGCTVKRNNFNNTSLPQIIIKDAMLID